MLLKADMEAFCMALERDHPGAPAAATLQHFYTIFGEREEQSAIIGKLRDALLAVRETLTDHHDIEDGGSPGEHPHQMPNWAMRATNEIDEVLRTYRLAKPAED